MAAVARRSVWEFALDLWRLSRPEVWMVTIVPAYVGWVLATREIAPAFHVWTGFWADAASRGATTRAFLDALVATGRDAWRLALGLIVLGPLAWAATLFINDVHDVESDRRNPRKASSPVVRGAVSPSTARAAAYSSAVVAVAVALAVGTAFAALTAACLVLAWAYSVPPLRLKARPGADVLVNAVGVGALAALAGWSVARPLAEFPFWFLPQGLLVAAAVYVPTTLVDFETDRESGDMTLAVHLGPRRAYLVGWWCWLLANAGALALSSNGMILPRRFFPILVVFVPLLLYEYHVFIGRARSAAEMVRGVILCSLTFLAVNVVFALMYTGLWV